METEIILKLNKCLGEMGIPASAITNEAHLSKDLGLDSLDITDLMIEIETIFDFRVPDSDWNKLQTVGQIQSYIKNHFSNNKAFLWK